MSRQRASCLISEEFVGCPQAWAAGRAKHGGGGLISPSPSFLRTGLLCLPSEDSLQGDMSSRSTRPPRHPGPNPVQGKPGPVWTACHTASMLEHSQVGTWLGRGGDWGWRC